MYINFLIIITDIREKIIPNKYLICLIFLLPLYIIYSLLLWDTGFWLNTLMLVSIISTFIISLGLHSFWIWSAWDAKYLMILALFIPNVWIIVFIWHIALITIIYLLLYFFWFYIWRSFLIRWHLYQLMRSISQDLRDRFLHYIYKWKNQVNNIYIYIKLLRYIIIFITVFMSVRIFRLYIIELVENHERLWINSIIVENYFYFFILGGILTSVISIIGLYYIYIKLRNYISNKKNISSDAIDNLCTISLFLILLWYLQHQLYINPDDTKFNLTRILTLLLLIYLIFICIKYLFKLAFYSSEIKVIHINQLKKWDIIDKTYLIKIFWQQKALWKHNSKWILSPDPRKYFLKLHNPLDKDGAKIIKRCYKIVNTYHKKRDTHFQTIQHIQVYKTFSFWLFIFLWFFISFLYWDKIFELIINNIIHYLKNFILI